MFDLPEPYGPMTAVIPLSKTNEVGVAKLLNPCISSRLSRVAIRVPSLAHQHEHAVGASRTRVHFAVTNRVTSGVRLSRHGQNATIGPSHPAMAVYRRERTMQRAQGD